MDSLGDWGYIIMTVVVLLISVLGKKPKKEDQNQLPRKQVKVPQRSIFQSLDEVFGEVKELRTDVREWNYDFKDEHLDTSHKTTPPPPPSSIKTNHPSVPVSTHSIGSSNESCTAMPAETSTSESFFSSLDLCDMKKAVIYSEILNRKYN